MTKAALKFHPNTPCLLADELDGREMEASYAFQFLGLESMQSVSFVGPEGIGKSSLLHALGDKSYIAANVPDRAENVFGMYVPLGELELNATEDFFRALTPLFAEVLDGAPVENAADFERLPEILTSLDRWLILLFDDFHVLTLNPELPARFFMGIRSHLSHCPRLGCVTTSYLPLQRLCASLELAGSPFFNIFSLYNLTALSQEASVQLLERRLQGANAAAVARTTAQAVGCHPRLLHVAGELLVARGGGALGGAELTDVLEQAYATNRAAYVEMIGSPDERGASTLRAALSRGKMDESKIEKQYVVEGLLRMAGDRLEFTSEHAERCARELLGQPKTKSIWKRLFG